MTDTIHQNILNMKINIEKILSNPVLAKVAAEHLAYSLQDVQIYDDLTPREKSIISEDCFKEILIDSTETYQSLKKKNPNHVILIRVGHFYTTYNDDAEIVAKTLGITLSRKPISLVRQATMPRHTIDDYLPKLIRAGYKVAIHDNP